MATHLSILLGSIWQLTLLCPAKSWSPRPLPLFTVLLSCLKLSVTHWNSPQKTDVTFCSKSISNPLRDTWTRMLVSISCCYYYLRLRCYFMILKIIALCSDLHDKVISDKSRLILEQVLALRVIILILQMKRSRFREPAWFAQRHCIDVAELTGAGTIPITTNGDFQFIHISLDSEKFMKYIFFLERLLFKFFIKKSILLQ